jgi:hypothetical protein
MKKQALLEKAAVIFSLVVLIAGVWFWGDQIREVLATLALAEA